MIILRPDQLALKLGIIAGWNSGARNMLGVLPTGGGKSIIVSDIVAEKNALGAQQVVIAHRNELISQMSLHVAMRGVPHRIIGPSAMVSQIVATHRREFNGRSFVSPSANCAVAGVDTLNARIDDLAKWAQQIDYWTIDEAHHVLRQNKWGRAAAMFPNAFGLGVTATPQRADGMGLGSHADGLFDQMIVGPSSRELMQLGAITDYDYVVPASDFEIDETDLPPSGDFSPKRMREASKKSHIVGDVVKEYVRRAWYKRCIVFATDVETAGEIAEQFKDNGIPAASVSAQTPTATRDEYVRRFRSGEIWVLVNVDLFGEGFDVPAVEVVSMARPTASLSVFMQQAGRALRTMIGKTHGLIIDHVSNYKRHGFPDKDRIWTLDRREKRGKRDLDPEEIPLTVCRNCSRPYERFHSACPHCGHAPVVDAAGRGSIERIDGDLILLDRNRLAEMRAAATLESPAAVAQRVGYAAGPIAGKGAANHQIERLAAQKRLSDAIAQWAGNQRALGRDDSQSYRRFYLTVGADVLSVLAQPRAEMEKTAAIVEGWL